MKTTNFLCGCFVLFAGLAINSASVCHAADLALYDASIGDREILTPAPPVAPRINGPKVFGARPGKKFVFRIPCQNFAGSYQHEKLDAAQYARWGFQYVTLWSIICAPFFFSCDIENIDDFTIGLLGNAYVVNINQDELGHVAEVIRNDDQTETVMVKKLANGSLALAVFNRNGQNQRVIPVDWHELGVSGSQEVFDVWRQKDLGAMESGIRVKLSPNGVGFFVLGNDAPISSTVPR